jgi:phosphonate transport system substrate-binding protein
MWGSIIEQIILFLHIHKETQMEGQTILFETFLPPARYKPFLHIIECVEHITTIPMFLLNGETLDDFADAYADAGIISPLSYIQLLGRKPCAVELLAVPVMQDEESEDAHPLFFDIVVRKEHALLGFDEIAKGTWAYHMERHRPGNQFADEQGDWGTPRTYFKETVEAASQAQALRLVLDKKADATAIDTRLLSLALRNSPAMAEKLVVLGTYSYSTGPLIIVATHVDSVLKQKLRDAFSSLHQNSFYALRLEEAGIERFIAVSNQHVLSMYSHVEDNQIVNDFAASTEEKQTALIEKKPSLAIL